MTSAARSQPTRTSGGPRATLVAPTGHGFVHVGAHSGTWRFPLALPSRRRRRLRARITTAAHTLRPDPRVLRTDVFTALLRPPGGAARAPSARYDVVLLVETTTPAAAAGLLEEAPLSALTRLDHVLGFAATSPRRIGPVDHERPGVFLFNYFRAPDVATNLAAWQQTAGWFQRETGLNNSTVLEPVGPAELAYTLVNHCRWDRLRDVLPSLALRRSFRGFVLRTFTAHDVVPEPLLYRMVRSGPITEEQ